MKSKKYIEINLTNDQFVSKLIHHIENGIPMSFSRLGDGEIHFINNTITQKTKTVLKETWGYVDLEIAKNNVLEIINNTISETDILGIMDEKNAISEKLNYNKNIWSIPQDYINNIREKELLIADHMIFRSQQFGNIYNFEKIIGGRDVCIISPRTEELKKKQISRKLKNNVTYLDVPMGINLKNRKNIFKQLDTIKEKIVLYGCSITGKDFGCYLKKRDKIALDFGATLDAWAGLETRSWFKSGGLQNHCLIKE